MPVRVRHLHPHAAPQGTLVTLVLSLLMACNAGSAQREHDGRAVYPSKAVADAPAHDVGSAVCSSCHPTQYTRWQSSQHARAMAEPNAETVLGDFADRELRYFDERARFDTESSAFVVHLRDGTGHEQRWPVRYSFGIQPLQQYLVEVGEGHLSALPFAYDTRPRTQGGQRWFHLHAEEHIRGGDELHWTAPAYNWNRSCADCHSTGVQRGYEADTGRYRTQFSEISVGCEACHGPGSRHVARARAGELANDSGFEVAFSRYAERSWERADNERIAHLTSRTARASEAELDRCGPCHARRSALGTEHTSSEHFHDRYRLALLEPELYFDDGQTRDEVFEFGSFLQSKMHAAGATCGDCHEPHAGELRAQGNALCARCHRPETYDQTSHHLHAAGSAGSQCVACHMPEHTYMTVDRRRDHRFVLPRPDLTLETGVPNACTSECHAKSGDRWARDVIAQHFGSVRPPDFARALHGARALQKDGDTQLLQLVATRELPAIVRATALSELARYPDVDPDKVLDVRRDESPLVRRALGQLSASFAEPEKRAAVTVPLLEDPVSSVRLEVAQALLDVPPAALEPAELAALRVRMAELGEVLQQDVDHPEALLVLAQLEGSESRYRRALELDPTLSRSYLAFAQFEADRGHEDRALALLRDGLQKSRDRAPLELALGLAFIRSRDGSSALRHLARAHRLAPDVPRIGFVYAVALHDLGRQAEAIRLLEDLARRFPGDRQLELTLAQYRRARH